MKTLLNKLYRSDTKATAVTSGFNLFVHKDSTSKSNLCSHPSSHLPPDYASPFSPTLITTTPSSDVAFTKLYLRRRAP